MKNWLDQDIVPGAIVYRAARAGNGTDHRVGIVRDFRKINRTYSDGFDVKVTIQWCLGAEGTTTVDIADVVLIDLTWDFIVQRMEEKFTRAMQHYDDMDSDIKDKYKWSRPPVAWWRKK